MADRPRQLDNRLEIVTPENIAFEYRIAGPFWRLPAYLIDLLIVLVLEIVIGLACMFAFGMAQMAGLGVMFGLIFWFVASWFYGGLFEALWNGQTPGKKLLGLRVVQLDGRPINALQAILRNILRSADSLPTFPLFGGIPMPCYIVGLASCSMTTRYQRLGDLACGTIVVIEERSYLGNLVRFDDPIVANMSAVLPADFAVSRSLGKALAAYADRRRYMTPSRRAEVARHVGSILVERFNLPVNTSHDLLLCALYHRTFVTQHQVTEGKRPFANPQRPALTDEELLQMVR
jgi:uncharacterized RDD family membrane protein YckC